MAAVVVRNLVLTCLLLCTLVSAQGRGTGISKYTRGQSDPRTCLAFFEEYLGASETPGDCQPEGKCECGTQGRSQIDGSQGVSHSASRSLLQRPATNQTFGLHAINCSYHPYGQHSLADIEQMQTAEVNDFKDGYNQHLDSHLGVWVSDLSTTIAKLEKKSVAHHAMTWSIGGTNYYSVMTMACGGFYIEFLSQRASGVDANKFHFTNETRFDFSNFTQPTPLREYGPIKVSRATTKMDAMIDFYTEIVEGSVTKRESVDGVDIAQVTLQNAPDMVMQFVNRPPATTSKFTVEDLENYVNSVHDEYVKNTNCGFDQFADHHWAYDYRGQSETLSSAASKLDAKGHKYRWFEIQYPSHNGYQIYAFDPSGWTLQLNFMPGNNVPDKVATYSPDCKSNDGCYGQGLCSSGPFWW